MLAGTTRPLSGREVARLSGGAPNTVRRALQRLTDHGIVPMQEAGAGATVLYTLNRDHVATDAILILVAMRRRFLEHLTTAIQAWEEPPTHASVFGSAARTDGDTASDIDLFIVRPAHICEENATWRAQLDDLAHQILAWMGNHAGIVEASPEEVQTLARERPPVVDELERDAITLTGRPVRKLLTIPA